MESTHDNNYYDMTYGCDNNCYHMLSYDI